MTDPAVAPMEYLRNVGLEPDEGFLQEGLQPLAQTAVELEAAYQIGTNRYERSPARKTYRNGRRERTWESRVGEVPPGHPQGARRDLFAKPARTPPTGGRGSLGGDPAGICRRREHSTGGRSPAGSGLQGIDAPALAGGARESKVSRICKELDEVAEPFRNRPLEGKYPFVWLDALYLRVRQNHHIVSQALVIAIGVREAGKREVLCFRLGASEEQAFWLDFLPAGYRDGVRSVVRRGLKDVQLVTSDAHEGLKDDPLGRVLAGAAWQRCRVHLILAPAVQALV